MASIDTAVSPARACGSVRARRMLATRLALALALLACAAQRASATDGYYDPTWTGGGRIAFDGDPNNPGDSFASVAALDSGGNVLLLGSALAGADTSAWLGQLQPNGQFVPSFGAANGTGRVDACSNFSPVLCGNDYGEAVAIQADGRYVVATSHHVFRTSAKALGLDGYESNIFTINDAGGSVLADEAVAIQSGNKILVGGAGHYSSTTSKAIYGVARLGSDLALDPTFGAMQDAQQTRFAGGALVDASADDAYQLLENLFVQPDGRIVLLGHGSPSAANTNYIETARLTADGFLDTSYGNAGATRLSWAYGTLPGAGRGVMDASGRVVVATTGVTTAFGVVGMLVTRVDASGSLDTSFGDASAGPGFSFNSNAQCTSLYGNAVALDSAGRVIVVGTCLTSSGNSYFAMERLRGDGTLDTTFGVAGFSLGSFASGSTSNAAYAVALDGSGHPIVAGRTSGAGSVSSGVARVTYDLIYTGGFETAPRGCLPPDCN